MDFRPQMYSEGHLLEAGGKPSTWFPPGRLVELTGRPDEEIQKTDMFAYALTQIKVFTIPLDEIYVYPVVILLQTQ